MTPTAAKAWRERQQQIDQRFVAGIARFEDADREQHRHHHQILKQQDRQRHAPDRRGGAVLVDQKLHHDRGRGQRKAHAENEAGGRRDAAHADGGPDHHDADRDLDEADTEHVTPQLPQARQRQFHAEQKQQKHDTEFGERLRRFRVFQRDVAQERVKIVEIADAERTEHEADQQKAEHRTEKPVQQRHEDAGGHEKDQDALQVFGVKHSFQFPFRRRRQHSSVVPVGGDLYPGAVIDGSPLARDDPRLTPRRWPPRSPSAPQPPWSRPARRPAPCRACRRRPCRPAPRTPCAPDRQPRSAIPDRA